MAIILAMPTARRLGICVLLVLTTIGPRVAATGRERIVEIRSYNLKADTRESFHDRFVRESLPMLRRWHIDVVAYGPSVHDESSYFLMRSFASLSERDRVEQAFYGSAEWRSGPRDAVLAAIENYTTIIIVVDGDTLRQLRRSRSGAAAAAIVR